MTDWSGAIVKLKKTSNEADEESMVKWSCRKKKRDEELKKKQKDMKEE